MRLFLGCEELSVEISDKDQRYQPDVLEDWCNRASKLMQEQRALTVCLNQPIPHVIGDG